MIQVKHIVWVVRQDEMHWSVTPQFYTEELRQNAIKHVAEKFDDERMKKSTTKKRNQTIPWLLVINGHGFWRVARNDNAHK